MASYISKLVAKKLLGESARNKFGFEDPYFENVPATKLDGKPGRVRRRRKANPPGLSDHDSKVLTKVKRRAYRLDCRWSLMGFRFGISSLIAVIPLIGDGFDILLACMVVRTCQQVEGGLPATLLMSMYFTVLLDFVIGLVPIVGDIGDAAYKANTKNAAKLEAFLRERGARNLRHSGAPVPDIDPSDPNEFEDYQGRGDATFTPDPVRGATAAGSSGTTAAAATTTTTPANAAAVGPTPSRRDPSGENTLLPPPAAARPGGGGGGGLLGYFRRGRSAPDIESGTVTA